MYVCLCACKYVCIHFAFCTKAHVWTISRTADFSCIAKYESKKKLTKFLSALYKYFKVANNIYIHT